MDTMLQRILELIPEKHGAKKELADSVGFPANLITDWKAGRNKSYPKYAARIADFYGVSLDWLSGKTDKKEKPTVISDDELTTYQKIAMQLFQSVPDEDQAAVLGMIRGYLDSKK
jgi:transcriptional regulator with XRE-family HTH domain